MQAERDSQVGICVGLAEPIEDLAEVKLNQLFSTWLGLPAGCPWGAICRATSPYLHSGTDP